VGRGRTIVRECLAVRQKAEPDDWRTFSTGSLLGDSLMGQGQYADAEPLILAGYEGMKAREPKIPAPSRDRLREAADRVVKLYASRGEEDKVREWQKKLGLLDLPANVFAQ